MELPSAHRATVDESKVVEYLLSVVHPDGRSKATFFTAFGFRRERWETFARALCNHGKHGAVNGAAKSDYGTRYSVDGVIETPDGRNPWIRTVWMVAAESEAPRLVTAYPLRRRDASRT